jgi:hypothetical protein
MVCNGMAKSAGKVSKKRGAAKRSAARQKAGSQPAASGRQATLTAADYSLGSPDFGKPVLKHELEFQIIQERAIAHFRKHYLAGAYPSKDELEEYFAAQRLADGSRISRHLISAMATLCRPLAAMAGGIRPQRKKGK